MLGDALKMNFNQVISILWNILIKVSIKENKPEWLEFYLDVPKKYFESTEESLMYSPSISYKMALAKKHELKFCIARGA